MSLMTSWMMIVKSLMQRQLGFTNWLTQNSGVMVTSSPYKFKNEKDGSVTYYGVLKDILELDYFGRAKFVLFKCEWFQSKQENFGLILVNFRKMIYKGDPFVFATQVRQVYYTEDPSDN